MSQRKNIRCSVVGCLPEKRQSSFRMPKDSPKACREWLRRAANKRYDENGDITRHWESFRICDVHFEPDCFIPDIYRSENSKCRIKKRSLPTLGLSPAIGSDLQPLLSAEEFYTMDTLATNTCSTEAPPPVLEPVSHFLPIQSRDSLEISDSMDLRKENVEAGEENMYGMKNILNDTLNELKKNNTEMKMLREEFQKNEENWKQEKFELYQRLQSLEERIVKQERGKTKSKIAIKVVNTENGCETEEGASAVDEIVYLNDKHGILAKILSNYKPVQIKKKSKKCEYICNDHDYLKGLKKERKKRKKVKEQNEVSEV